MIEEIRQQLRDLKRRTLMAIGRCVLDAIDDSQTCQTLQIELLSEETTDGVERFQNYAFSSVPFPGAEGVMVSVGGLRSHGIVIAIEDRRWRPTGMQPGESAHYDDQGQVIQIKRGGIFITSTLHATVAAPHVDLISPDVNLGATGGKKVVLDGDPVSGGVVHASSTSVKAT